MGTTAQPALRAGPSTMLRMVPLPPLRAGRNQA